MEIITQNAEERLLSTLKECWEKYPNHRCLHMKSFPLKDGDTEILGFFIKTVYAILEDKAMQIFICQDSDVFILSRYLSKKRVSEVLQVMSPKLMPDLNEDPAFLYDIGADWPLLRQICRSKVEKLADKKSKVFIQEEKTETESLSVEDVLKKIDRDLIATLKARRELRKTCEVMIVEDDIFSQNLVKSILKNKYDVLSTDDGIGAIISYVKNAPDILFLDIGLPDLNGHDVLKKIFEIDPTAYVVMLSGNGDKQNVLKAIELGAKGFISKPFTHEKIHSYIEKSPFIKVKQGK